MKKRKQYTMTQVEAIAKAIQIADTWVNINHDPWPENVWIDLSDNWDLNLSTEGEQDQTATLHSKEDDEFISVSLPSYITRRQL